MVLTKGSISAGSFHTATSEYSPNGSLSRKGAFVQEASSIMALSTINIFVIIFFILFWLKK
jgi:hypothetical protein